MTQDQELSQQLTRLLENVANQFYNAIYKEVKKNIRLEGDDYQTGYKQGVEAAKRKLLENFPMWKVAEKDDYLSENVITCWGEFGTKILYRGQFIKKGWRYITIKSLKTLPVEVVNENEELHKTTEGEYLQTGSETV